jgi:hypothetical protein
MIHLLSDLPTWFTSVTHLNDVLQSADLNSSDQWMVLAQQIKQTDLFGDTSRAWNHFVKTGQVWAMIIGMVLGYMAKTFTSFG